MLDRSLLDACRPVMILAAFFTQKPSLMHKPEWQGLRVSNQTSNAESDLCFLMSILAELPDIYIQCEDYSALVHNASSPFPSAPVTLLWTKLKDLERGLQCWKQNWENLHGHSAYSGEFPIFEMSDSDSTIAVSFTYPSTKVELAITFAMYHGVVILLTNPQELLLQACTAEGNASALTNMKSFPRISHQQYHSDLKTSMLSIYRTSQYLLQSSSPPLALADFYIFFPIHVAWRAANQLGLPTEAALLSDSYGLMKSRFPTGVWANMDFGDRFCGLQEGLFG